MVVGCGCGHSRSCVRCHRSWRCAPIPKFQHDGLPDGAGARPPSADGGRHRGDGGGRRSDPPHSVPVPNRGSGEWGGGAGGGLSQSRPPDPPGDRAGEGGGAAGVVVRGHRRHRHPLHLPGNPGAGHGAGAGHGRRGIRRGEAVRGHDDAAGDQGGRGPGAQGVEEAGGRRAADGARLAAGGYGGAARWICSADGVGRHGTRRPRRGAALGRVVDAVVDAGRRRRDGGGGSGSCCCCSLRRSHRQGNADGYRS
mmetsp:Transcript_30713/g.89686  ORF Transcript_30713/g.89686 Transcript_30713/m.89686 type:complete len:253 (-) Transcript_30713:817-1575(-)